MEDKEKYIIGKWYKDRDGDFIKFDGFDTDSWGGVDVKFTESVQCGEYEAYHGEWGEEVFSECIPMSIEEMKEHLPEKEWWTENNNELFPLF